MPNKNNAEQTPEQTSGGISEEIQHIVHEPRYWLIAVLAIIITAVLSGGGVWWLIGHGYYDNILSNLKKDNWEQSTEIKTLNDNIQKITGANQELKKRLLNTVETIPSSIFEISSFSTENWKKYQSQDAGFYIYYPDEWFDHAEDEATLFLTKSKTLPDIRGTEGYAYGNQIHFYKENLDKTVNEWITENVYSSDEYNHPLEIEWKTTDKIKALRIKESAAGTSNDAIRYHIFGADYVYSFFAYPYYSTSDVLDKIISTFKFTN